MQLASFWKSTGPGRKRRAGGAEPINIPDENFAPAATGFYYSTVE